MSALADGPRIMPHHTPGDRMAPLRAWLDQNDARLLWEVGPQKSSYAPMIRGYLVRGTPVMVTIFSGERGWNLFVEAAPHTNRVSDSLAAATAAIGNGCRLPAPEEPKREPG